MNELRAFVGHSFTEDDADVVSKFLHYFDQIAKSKLNFSWEHAEPAEPKILSEKVLSLMEGKNMFIGICTKKERVVSPGHLKSAIWPLNALQGQKNNFDWKTSDWIIQEIGLAKGKGLEIILLVENALRQPGGLQGNLEYIPFQRNAPEKSFGKIIEMLNALAPKVSSTAMISSDRQLTKASEIKEEPDESVDFDPKPEWGREDYEMAFILKFREEDEQQAEKIAAVYLNTPEGNQYEARTSWAAFTEYVRLVSGKGGTVQKLKELAAANPESVRISEFIAKAYAYKKLHTEAAAAFELAGSKLEGTERLRLLRRAAIEYWNAEEHEAANSVLNTMKTVASTEAGGELHLLKTINEYFTRNEDHELSTATMERLVEVDPDDNSILFQLALKYSNAHQNDLALLTYLKIPELERDPETWNNIGVAYQEAGLVAKAVKAYQWASDRGSTVSMSNLAAKFLTEGFTSHARELCERVMKLEEGAENIGQTLLRLQTLEQEEDSKEANLISQAKPKSRFLNALGRGLVLPDVTSLAPQWRGPDCVFDVSISGNQFRAEGTYERASLAGALSSILGSPLPSKPTRFNVSYSGVIRGQTIEAHVKRVVEGSVYKPSLIGGESPLPKVLMFLSEDRTKLHVMESPTSGELQLHFYDLVVVNRM